MRKTFRKIVLSVLAISSGLSFTATISKNDGHTHQTNITPLNDDFDDLCNDPVLGNLEDSKAALEKIMLGKLDEYVEPLDPDSRFVNNYVFKGGKGLIFVTKLIILTISLCKKIPQAEELKDLVREIVSTITQIYQKVNVINSKMNDLASTLDQEFAKIHTQFSELKIRDDLNVINSFNKDAYDQYYNHLNTSLNIIFRELSDPVVSTYKDKYKFDMSYLLELEKSTGHYITIDGNDVKSAFEATKISNPFDVNDVRGWFNRYAKYLYANYLDLETTGLNRALTRRRELGFTDDTFVDAFANGFYEYLRIAYSKVIFSQSNQYATYIAQIINTFNSYCSAFNTPDSPLLRQYDIFTNLFCFQGDTYYYNQFNERRSLVLDIGYAYLFNLFQFGDFVEEAAMLSGLVNDDQLDQIEDTLSNAINSIISLMQSFYKVDVNGVPLDRYCYSTKSVLEVVKNNITTNKPTTVDVEKTSGKIDLEGNMSGVSFGDIVVNEVNKETRLNADEITYLSILQGKMPILSDKEDTRPTFNEYLNETFNTEITSNLAISFDNPQNITDNNGYVYNAYSFGDPTDPDGHGGMFYNNIPDGFDERMFIMGLSGYHDKDKFDDDCLRRVSEVRGSYFNLDTNQMVYDDSLFSYAFYYEENENWDDIGYFSSAKIAGKKNVISTFNTSNNPNVGDVVFQDQATTIKISNRDGDVRTHEITTNFDIFAINKVNVEYGKVALDDCPFTSNLTKAEIATINSHISAINKKYNLQGKDSLKDVKKTNNDSEYNFIFDKLGDPDNYDNYMNKICSEDNLRSLHDAYNNLESSYDLYFKDINPATYENSLYFDSEISGEELNKSVEAIKAYMQNVSDFGFDTGGYIKPGPNATDFKIMYKVTPQINEVLSFTSNEEIECKILPSYVLKPALTFVEGGSRIYGDLPHQTYSFVKPPKDLKIKLPMAVQNLSNKCASIEFNEDATMFGADPSYIQGSMGLEGAINYINLNANAFGAYSLIDMVDAKDSQFELVPSQEPTCLSPGHKVAYKLESKYYYEPNEAAEIGDLNAYKTWISEGGGGYIEPTGKHNYQYVDHTFDSTSKKFTVNFKCSGCEDTESITVDGTFVTDTPATCKEAAKGHYCATGEYEGTPYYVSDETSYDRGDPLSHHLIHHLPKAATCTVPGNNEYYECSECGEKFEDAAGKKPFEGETVIPPINHEGKEYHPYKDSTYDENGNLEYWYCPHCGYYYLDEACTQRTSLAHIIIPKKQYEFIEIPKKDPDHFEAGHRAYWFCKSNGKYYSDPNAVNEIVNLDEWLAPGGEGYLKKENCIFDGDPTYTLEGNTCTATISCSYEGCGQFISETVEVEYVVDTPATCESNAFGHIVANFDNPVFGAYTTSTDSYEFPDTKLGHHFINPSITWDGNVCTLSGVCSDCGKEVKLSKAGTVVIDEAATCHSNAIGHYEVIFNVLREPIKSLPFEIPDTMTDHDFGNFEAVWEGNICILTGKCIHDGCEETVTYIQQGTIVIDTPATCTENAKGHYVASFNIDGVEVQQTATNSVTIENTILRHEFDEHGECVHCHRASPEAVARKATIDNDALNGAAIAVCCVSGSSLALASFFILKHLRLKKKKL